MKKTIIGLSILTLTLGYSMAKCIPGDPNCSKASNENTICTMEYAPVCASVQVKCIQAPCPPIKQTFGNKCQMNANSNAQFLYEGECSDDIDLSNCEAYFDGCNNCSVVDGKISACTEMYCENPGPAKCTKYKSQSDLSNCESYFDGCNTCSVIDGKIAGCTKMYCQTNQEAACLKYKDGVGMANPASLHCEKNGGNLVIENSDKGQYGICVFDDGSTCEEWAFFRGECKKASPVEKYLSGYMAQNSDDFSDTKSKINFLHNLKDKFVKVYRNIATSIQEFIEKFYISDYEIRKFTLELDNDFISFSLHLPKYWENKYGEKVILEQDSSTIIFSYKAKDNNDNMIFSITMRDMDSRKELEKQGLLNTTKITGNDKYIFSYSQSLDMPYTGEDAENYSNMNNDISTIINSFKLLQQ